MANPHSRPQPTRAKRRALLLAWLAAASLSLLVLASTVNWSLIRHRTVNNHVMRELGHVGYLAWELKRAVATFLYDARLHLVDPEPYRAFIAGIQDANTTIPAPASSAGKHLVFIQIESVDNLSVRARFDGEPVMPFLYQLRRESIDFLNHFDNSDAGRTTDGEFLVLTSLPPLADKSAFVSYDLSQVPSLPRLLRQQGYRAVSMHGFDGHFWNRRQAHQQLGYQQSYFESDLDQSDIIGWGVSDRSVLQQAADLLESAEQPTFLHVILLTNHHPYHHVGERFGHPKDSIVANHVDSLRYTDSAIAAFFERLQNSNTLDQSLIAIFGDHDSGIARQLRQAYVLDETPVRDTLPLLLYGFSHPSQRITKASGHQDLPVIVLRELGIPIPHTFTGNALDTRLPTYHPKRGAQTIVDGKIRSERPPVSLNRLTKLALLHPEKLKPQP